MVPPPDEPGVEPEPPEPAAEAPWWETSDPWWTQNLESVETFDELVRTFEENPTAGNARRLVQDSVIAILQDRGEFISDNDLPEYKPKSSAALPQLEGMAQEGWVFHKPPPAPNGWSIDTSNVLGESRYFRPGPEFDDAKEVWSLSVFDKTAGAKPLSLAMQDVVLRYAMQARQVIPEQD